MSEASERKSNDECVRFLVRRVARWLECNASTLSLDSARDRQQLALQLVEAGFTARGA